MNKPDNDTGLHGKRFLKQWGFSDGINNLGKWDAVLNGAITPTDPYMAYLHKRGLAAMYVADMRKRSHARHADTWPSPLPEDAYCDNWIARNGLKLMQSFPKDQPWFLMVNFAGPHDPWDVTQEMWERWRGVKFPPPDGSDGYSQEVNNNIRRNYSAMVENIDRWMGVYLRNLEKRGELENTLVAYCSDHGEMLGDHDLWGKWVPYQPSVSVPLIMAGPGVKNYGPCDALVSTMDLAATFLDYGGVERPADMDSRSFRPLLEGQTNHHRDWLLSGLDLWRLSYNGRYKFIDRFDPTFPGRGKQVKRYSAAVRHQPPLLFDELKDPEENSSLLHIPHSQAEDENSGLSRDASCTPHLTGETEFSG